MKTFLAALAAGILGGGAAIGAVALDLVPLEQIDQTARVTPVETEDDDFEDLGENTGDLKEQIRDLEMEVQALKVKQAKQPADESNGELAELRAEFEAYKASTTVSAKPVGEDADATGISEAPAVTPEFDAAVRGVIDRIQEERAEERRLERQADRLERLEESKQRISEFVPTFVENRASQLNIPEASVPDVSSALVTHMQFRAEILSEMEGLRIDDQEVDQEMYEEKLTQLNETTLTSLSAYVDETTAQSLINALGRSGNNNRNGRRGGPRQR